MIIERISDDKNSIAVGGRVYVFVEEERLKSSCAKCAFRNANDCSHVPCMPYSRQPVDRREGHFELLDN